MLYLLILDSSCLESNGPGLTTYFISLFKLLKNIYIINSTSVYNVNSATLTLLVVISRAFTKSQISYDNINMNSVFYDTFI